MYPQLSSPSHRPFLRELTGNGGHTTSDEESSNSLKKTDIHSRRASVFRKSMVDDSSHLMVDDRSRPSHRVLFDDRAFRPYTVGERTVGESPDVRVPGRSQPPCCSTSQVGV